MGRRAKPGEPPANRRALDRKLSGSALEEPQFKGGQTCEETMLIENSKSLASTGRR